MKSSRQKDEAGQQSRRRFLKTFVAATGGAVAVGAAGKVMATPEEGMEPEHAPEKHGYSETQHVKDYYARARF